MSISSNAEALLFAALEKPTAAERAAYLESACAGDAELRRQVERLLKAHADAGSFLEEPVVEKLRAASDDTQAFDIATPRKQANPAQTQAEGAADDADGSLHFLKPSTRPGSLGRLGHYEVLQALGKGGFGLVFRAFDEVLQRVVALKVLAPQIAATSPARKRFLREARSSAQVRHENIVQVYEVAESGEGGLPYLAMEFIPGETLQQKIDRVGPLEVSEVLRIGRQIAEGLAAAHATDLIHRDIKPGNVLLEGGQHRVKITDFGLARAADDASISQSGIIAGTPMYMAPEQALGHKLDQRADLFSLGSVLYQMVSGRPPFRANTTVAVLKRVAEDQPRAIREIIPETPQWLCDIIAKLHAKNPDDRYQSAREVADVLADCEAQLKANSKLQDYSRIPKNQSQRSGRRKWVAAAACVLLPLAALVGTEFGGVTHLFQRQPAPDPIQAGNNPMPAVQAISPPETKTPPEVAAFTDADRRAAEYVLSIGGTVRINGNDSDIRAPEGKLPAGAFQLAHVDLNGNKQVTDSGLAVFKDCKNVTFLSLWGCGQITDAGLAHFKYGKKLTHLLLEGVPATAGGLAVFAGNKDLTELLLGNTPATDAGLVYFKDCKKLKGIRLLNASGVTDASLAHLTDFKELTSLDLRGAGVTAAGREALQKALPKCRIEFDGGVIEPNASIDPDRRAAEYVLSIGGRVRIDGNDREIGQKGDLPKETFRLRGVDLSSNRQVTDSGLAAFKDCKNVTHLTLWGCGQITDAGLAHFKNCKGLTDLWLENVQITSAGLAMFKDCDLTRINLAYTQATDAGLAYLADCKNLNTISLLGRPVTDAGLAHLKRCKQLTLLDLRGARVTDVGLAYFKDCKALTNLWLAGAAGITDAGLAHFKDCQNLEDLELTDTPITDAGLALFKDCKKLNQVRLGGTSITDAGLAHLKGLEKLARLQFPGTQITNAGLAHIKDMPLVVLVMNDTRITDLTALQGMPLEFIGLTPKNVTKGLDILRDMTSLKTIGTTWYQAWPAAEFWQRYEKGEFGTAADNRDPDRRAAEYVLSIGGGVCIDGNDQGIRTQAELPIEPFRLTRISLDQNKKVTDSGLAAFQGCKNVTTLGLYGCGQITDAGLAHFKDCKKLSVVELEHTRVTDASLPHFAGCKDLTSLGLNNTLVTDAGLVHLKDCRKLTGIGFLNTPVTDAGLANLKDCKNLTGIDLRCTKVTDAGLAHFKDCKNLSVLWLDGASVTGVGLAQLKDCKDLKELLLHNASITDAGLVVLKDFNNLELLDLGGTAITDATLAHLKDHKKLARLILNDTPVTDAGLAHLAGLNGLTILTLNGTKVSDAGLGHLKGMPLVNLHIHNTGIFDLTHLQSLRLEEIRLTPKNITTGLDSLRDMKSLRIVGTGDQAWPAAEFWQRFDKGEFK